MKLIEFDKLKEKIWFNGKFVDCAEANGCRDLGGKVTND